MLTQQFNICPTRKNRFVFSSQNTHTQMNIISYLLFTRSQKQLSQCFSFPRGKTPKYFPDVEQLTENTKIEYLTHITYFAITVDLLIESLLSKSNTSLHPGVHYLNKRFTKGTPLCIKRARYKRTLFFFHSSFFWNQKIDLVASDSY